MQEPVYQFDISLTDAFPVICEFPTSILPHFHAYVEMVFVEKGALTLKLEGTEVTVAAGGGLYINPGVMHQAPQSPSTVFCCMVIPLSWLLFLQNDIFSAECLSPLSSGALAFPLLAAQNEAEILAEMSRLCAARPFGWQLSFKAACYRLLSLLYQNRRFVPAAEAKGPDGLIRQAVRHIEENLCGPLSTSGLCEALSVSKTTLCRKFLSQTGMTVTDFIRRKRLELALRYMGMGNTVATSAFCAGFNNLSYFNRIFKKMMGQTPMEYKKNGYSNHYYDREEAKNNG